MTIAMISSEGVVHEMTCADCMDNLENWQAIAEDSRIWADNAPHDKHAEICAQNARDEFVKLCAFYAPIVG
jgi:hypothetical protein